jgi:uncharacterized membrane protein
MALSFLNKVNRKWVLWILLDILIFLVFALLAWRYFPVEKQTAGQLDIALKILNGWIPYVHIATEYPPLVLLFYLIPALFFRSLVSYYVAFTVQLLLFDVLGMFLVAKIGSRLGISLNKALLLHAVLIAAAGPIVVASFDIIPAVMVLAALACFISGKSQCAWAIAGLGFMTKLFPIIIVPFFVIYQLRQKQYKQMAEGAAILVLIIMALSLPWLTLNARGFWATYVYHIERGLHSESTYGTALLLGKIMGLIKVGGIYNYGSWNLYSPLAYRLAGLSFVIAAGLLCAVYVFFIRDILKKTPGPVKKDGLNPASVRSLIQFATAAVLIFMLSGKVFSMQYIVWLCPLLPLISGRWQSAVYAIFLAACVFSQFVYPYFYAQFEQFAPSLVVMMFIRNALLLVCAVFLLLPGERLSKAALESAR